LTIWLFDLLVDALAKCMATAAAMLLQLLPLMPLLTVQQQMHVA